MLHHLNIICILMIEGTNVMLHGSRYKKMSVCFRCYLDTSPSGRACCTLNVSIYSCQIYFIDLDVCL